MLAVSTSQKMKFTQMSSLSLLVHAAVFVCWALNTQLCAAYLTLRSSEHEDVSLFCSVPILSQVFIRSPTDNRTFPTTFVFEQLFFFWSSSADPACVGSSAESN